MTAPVHAPSPRLNPLESARLIQFSLFALSGDNGHHEFEVLCRMLARARITPNVIPCTGPVSAGGDQGIDFETHSVSEYASGSMFFAEATRENWKFACSLQKDITPKIRRTVKELAAFTPAITKVFFFHSLPIEVGRKHALEKEALQKHGLNLEILDSLAISEMLSHTDTVWIAERFLNLPASFTLAQPERQARWYERYINEPPTLLTDGYFYEVREAVREAAYSEDERQSCLQLYKELRRFRSSDDNRLKRKAIYEEFVSSLRGLGFCEGYADDVRAYLAVVDELEDPSDLEDAGALLSYAITASRIEGLGLSIDELRDWHARLTSNIERRKGASKNSAHRLALMKAESSLILSKGFLDDWAGRDVAPVLKAARKAVELWLEMILLAEEVPLFPIEIIAKYTDIIAVILDRDPKYEELESKVDALLAARAGKQVVVDRHIDRAISYLQRDEKLRALRETHLAHLDALEPKQAVNLCLMLAKSYAELRLHFAAKHYALASSFAALRLPEEDLRRLASRGFVEAAQADYTSGASILFLVTASLFAIIDGKHARGVDSADTPESDPYNMFYLYLFNLRFWAERKSEPVKEVFADAIRKWDLEEEFKEMSPSMFSAATTDIESARPLLQAENVGMYFSDVGGRRTSKWEQLGLVWTVTWETHYELEVYGETICAFLQIMLAELADVELSIIGRDVELHLINGTRKEKLLRKPSNDRYLAEFFVGEEDAEVPFFVSALSVVVAVLDELSASSEEVLERIKSRLDSRLMQAMFAYASADVILRTFYGKKVYEEIYAAVSSDQKRVEPHAMKTHNELSGTKGLHPRYSKAESEEAVGNRYRRIQELIPFTIARLKACKEFLQTVRSLRASGWKDWHLLSAIISVRWNALYQAEMRDRSAAGRKLVQDLLKRKELDQDQKLPCSLFSEENLRLSLTFSAMSTLESMGFVLKSQTPNLEAADAFLRNRLRYWDDDIPHDPIF